MRLKARPGVAPLSPAVVAIVLGGWGAKPPAGEDDKAGIFSLAGGWGAAASPDDPVEEFDLFQQREAGIIRVWRRHEAFLRSEAKRLGIVPAFVHNGHLLFYAQWAMLPWQERAEAETAAALAEWDDDDDDHPEGAA